MKEWLRTVIVVVVAAVLLVVPTNAQADDPECLPEIGAELPVIFVHGFNSGRRMWEEGGDRSLLTQLDMLEHFKLAVPFDYEAVNTRWVTHAEIGPKLARRIACIAANSRKAGGPGKVAVVAHSMGGLAVRFAASQVVDGRKVSDDLGLVVTIGTPHHGTITGNVGNHWETFLCRYGNLTYEAQLDCLNNKSAYPGLGTLVTSENLQDLPSLPAHVPALAIGGNVHVLFSPFFGSSYFSTNSDLVVGIRSAVAAGNKPEQGGGVVIVKCDSSYLTDLAGTCWHNELPKNIQVHNAVVSGLLKYRGWLRKNASANQTPAAPACVSKEWLTEQWNRSLNVEGLREFTILSIDCEAGWAVAKVETLVGDSRQIVVNILRLQGNEWVYPPGERAEHCAALPEKLKQVACN